MLSFDSIGTCIQLTPHVTWTRNLYKDDAECLYVDTDELIEKKQ